MGLSKRGYILALYEIGAAFNGLWILVTNSLHSQGGALAAGLSFAAVLSVSIASLAAGIFLFMGKTWGKRLSFIVQGLQVPFIVLDFFRYYFMLAFGLVVGFKLPAFLTGHFLGGSVKFSMAIGNFGVNEIAVNLVALLFLYFAKNAFKKPVS